MSVPSNMNQHGPLASFKATRQVSGASLWDGDPEEVFAIVRSAHDKEVSRGVRDGVRTTVVAQSQLLAEPFRHRAGKVDEFGVVVRMKDVNIVGKCPGTVCGGELLAALGKSHAQSGHTPAPVNGAGQALRGRAKLGEPPWAAACRVRRTAHGARRTACRARRTADPVPARSVRGRRCAPARLERVGGEGRDPAVITELSQPGPALPAVRALVRRCASEAASPEDRLNGCLITNTAAEPAPHDPAAARRVEISWDRIERSTVYTRLILADGPFSLSRSMTASLPPTAVISERPIQSPGGGGAAGLVAVPAPGAGRDVVPAEPDDPGRVGLDLALQRRPDHLATVAVGGGGDPLEALSPEARGDVRRQGNNLLGTPGAVEPAQLVARAGRAFHREPEAALRPGVDALRVVADRSAVRPLDGQRPGDDRRLPRRVDGQDLGVGVRRVGDAVELVRPAGYGGERAERAPSDRRAGGVRGRDDTRGLGAPLPRRKRLTEALTLAEASSSSLGTASRSRDGIGSSPSGPLVVASTCRKTGAVGRLMS